MARNGIKYLLVTCFFVIAFAGLKAQTASDINWPPENLRADTITTYFFLERKVLASTIPTAKARSNFGFSTKQFDAIWMPVRMAHADDFIKRSARHFSKYKVSDTLQCSIFGEEHNSIVLTSGHKAMILIYRNNTVYQDVYLISKIRKRNVSKAIEYLDTWLVCNVRT